MEVITYGLDIVPSRAYGKNTQLRKQKIFLEHGHESINELVL
jgi:hypothetical protein